MPSRALDIPSPWGRALTHAREVKGFEPRAFDNEVGSPSRHGHVSRRTASGNRTGMSGKTLVASDII